MVIPDETQYKAQQMSLKNKHRIDYVKEGEVLKVYE